MRVGTRTIRTTVASIKTPTASPRSSPQPHALGHGFSPPTVDVAPRHAWEVVARLSPSGAIRPELKPLAPRRPDWRAGDQVKGVSWGAGSRRPGLRARIRPIRPPPWPAELAEIKEERMNARAAAARGPPSPWPTCRSAPLRNPTALEPAFPVESSSAGRSGRLGWTVLTGTSRSTSARSATDSPRPAGWRLRTRSLRAPRHTGVLLIGPRKLPGPFRRTQPLSLDRGTAGWLL